VAGGEASLGTFGPAEWVSELRLVAKPQTARAQFLPKVQLDLLSKFKLNSEQRSNVLWLVASLLSEAQTPTRHPQISQNQTSKLSPYIHSRRTQSLIFLLNSLQDFSYDKFTPPQYITLRQST